MRQTKQHMCPKSEKRRLRKRIARLRSRLLGAAPILVGIRPELAQAIVGLGLDLASLKTQADLQSGICYAIQQQALRVQR
jgi:hypothetical protein